MKITELRLRSMAASQQPQGDGGAASTAERRAGRILQHVRGGCSRVLPSLRPVACLRELGALAVSQMGLQGMTPDVHASLLSVSGVRAFAESASGTL